VRGRRREGEWEERERGGKGSEEEREGERKGRTSPLQILDPLLYFTDIIGLSSTTVI